MKVLHVCNFDGVGGAGIAARRLHVALDRIETLESRMLVRIKVTDDERVEAFCRGSLFLSQVYSSIISKLSLLWGGTSYSINLFPTELVRKLNGSDADIIHLHWINAEMVSVKQLAKITKPVVWTLHDMWPFSGAQHYVSNHPYGNGFVDCEGKIDSTREKIALFVDRWVYKRKVRHWRHWNPTIVTPSLWLSKCASESMLFNRLDVKVIPNCLDLETFKPTEKQQARELLGLPADKKLVLFGAVALDDYRKGGDLLGESLRNLTYADVELVVFGGADAIENSAFKVHRMGGFSEEKALSKLYNACDLMCVPSRQDNLPNTAVEAAACGLPVVAFNIGGLSDIVQHHRTGYLADPYDPRDLAKGIEWVVGHDEAVLRIAARKHAEMMFSESAVIDMYKKLYFTLI
jgi:glycosyltransferase involved in cell wall biosynthesis